MSRLSVLYQTNEYYAVVTGVSMTSLLHNNTDIEELDFIVLDDEMSDASRRKMSTVCEHYGRQVAFVDAGRIKQRLIELKVTPFRNTYTTYFKLLAWDELSTPDMKLLMLDGDTVINGSLRELADLDLSGHLFAAVAECAQNSYKPMIGLGPQETYYNCGVLLVNLQAWQGQHCTQQIIDHLANVRSGYFSVDQDIINVLFRKQIRKIDLTYNFNCGFDIYGVDPSFDIYELEPEFYYPREHVRAVQAAPLLNHAMGAMTGRPWEAGNIHPQNDLWDRYLAISPWAGYVKQNKGRSATFRRQRLAHRYLPTRVYVAAHRTALKRYLRTMNAHALAGSDAAFA